LCISSCFNYREFKWCNEK